MGQLEGKVAIVTGGGRGIGRGIALVLAGDGADVLIADVDLENAERTAKEIEALGRRAAVERVDVTDPATTRAGVQRAVSELGGLHILVNNAGVLQNAAGPGTRIEDFDRCFEINLKGVWHMTTAAVPHFQAQREGKIVNVASIAARHGGPLIPYAISKAGVISLTQSLAKALGKHDITVNAVCPGYLWTDMWREIEGLFSGAEGPVDQRTMLDTLVARDCVLGREQTPEDVGHAVSFLASSLARNITGQALNVDGGIEMN